MSDDPQLLQVGQCQMMKAENGRISKAHTEAEDGFTVRYLTRDAGDGVSCGFVFIDPCEVDYTIPMDETIYVIEGAAEISLDGAEAVTIEAGDAVFVPKGTDMSWKVTAPWHGFWTVRVDESGAVPQADRVHR